MVRVRAPISTTWPSFTLYPAVERAITARSVFFARNHRIAESTRRGALVD